MQAEQAARKIAPRRLAFDFSEVPVHWVTGRPFATHLLNALSLLFPPGERWFGRVCRHLLAWVEDPQLHDQVRGFWAQEGTHASGHQKALDRLEAQGLRIGPSRRLVERVIRRVEGRLRRGTQLAVMAAIEQHAAAISTWLLRSPMIAGAERSAMLDLFRWHAAEEIEHKCVAFDLLETVHPGYWTRIVAFQGLSVVLFALWGWFTVVLVLSDRSLPRRAFIVDGWRCLRRGELPIRDCVGAFLRYHRPDFHPSQESDDGSASAYLAGVAVR